RQKRGGSPQKTSYRCIRSNGKHLGSRTVASIIARAQVLITNRLATISSYKPAFVAVSRTGFTGYHNL
ncbi:MAG TPA: hypothetical protein VE843_07305, partial [Ktedonobacteraceae bacterium]|nr:hypothetical protein [Ktedonobacteraceae bacterium]